MARGNTSAKETHSARQKRLEEERRRQRAQERKRKQVVAGVVVAVLVVAGIVGYFVVANLTKSKVGTQATPTGVTSGFAVPQGTAAAPVTMDLYEDFQCPVCAEFEKASGAAYQAMITAGTVKVNFHVLNFLDAQTATNNTYSTRSATLALCVNQSAPTEFVKAHDALFANQPKEGQAAKDTSTDTMIGWMRSAGLDPTPWQSCAKGDQFTTWINNATTNAQTSLAALGKPLATPSIVLNGKAVTSTGPDLVNPAWITQQINDAAAAAKK